MNRLIILETYIHILSYTSLKEGYQKVKILNIKTKNRNRKRKTKRERTTI